MWRLISVNKMCNQTNNQSACPTLCVDKASQAIDREFYPSPPGTTHKRAGNTISYQQYHIMG